MNEIKDRVSPQGGKLTDLIVEPGRRDELETASQNFVSLSLTPRQLCDLELLLNGGFSPLTGFMACGSEPFLQLTGQQLIIKPAVRSLYRPGASSSLPVLP